jgi:hypothetical protein
MIEREWSRDAVERAAKIDDKTLDSLFREARSFTKWQTKTVTDETLRDLYEGTDQCELQSCHCAAATPPPGSFFLKKKAIPNMIADPTQRTINVSTYDRVAACACNDR